MPKKHLDPAYACWECGTAAAKKAGIVLPETMVSTWYPGTCGVCGKKTTVTEARDYGHPWVKMARMSHSRGKNLP